MIVRYFRAHPQAVGETYAEHMTCAARYGGKLVLAGLACIAHAVFPFLFADTASKMVRELHGELTARRPSPAPRERNREAA